jgi:GTPase SAR1 family protein
MILDIGRVQMRDVGDRGALIVVGGHSRGVGKTTVIERLLHDSSEDWIAIKISAHRHAPAGTIAPLIEETRRGSSSTQTGRYLVAGARRAFLVRAPDAALPQVAALIDAFRTDGSNVVVESNRIVQFVRPDVCLFVVDPRIDDWKPSSSLLLAASSLHRRALRNTPS